MGPDTGTGCEPVMVNGGVGFDGLLVFLSSSGLLDSSLQPPPCSSSGLGGGETNCKKKSTSLSHLSVIPGHWVLEKTSPAQIGLFSNLPGSVGSFLQATSFVSQSGWGGAEFSHKEFTLPNYLSVIPGHWVSA